MDFSAFSTITFDCYGTLIDWEAGILPVLRSVLAAHGQTLPDARILELYGEFEAQARIPPHSRRVALPARVSPCVAVFSRYRGRASKT